ncbi:hypothetical protein MNBD_UNCLBAC01-568 [hydrothermal vent metagenome]|uniref:Uncharacterized protein n=1 Tax=hydrothermal vent metagenome TaxID=652676 RepID=A0A3B1DYJ8_9ZZZZ
MLRRKQKGQTVLEYAILLVIIMGAFLAISAYLKRGIQGRWKSAADNLGDQYDPRTADSSLNYMLVINSTTTVIAVPDLSDPTKMRTERIDTATSVDRKTGTIKVGAY